MFFSNIYYLFWSSWNLECYLQIYNEYNRYWCELLFCLISWEKSQEKRMKEIVNNNVTFHVFENIVFWKNPKIFRFVTLPWKLWRKQSFTPTNSTKMCYNPWKSQSQKPRPMKIPIKFFLITPRNSTSFLLDLDFPHAISSIPLHLVWIFSGIDHFFSLFLKVIMLIQDESFSCLWSIARQKQSLVFQKRFSANTQ